MRGRESNILSIMFFSRDNSQTHYWLLDVRRHRHCQHQSIMWLRSAITASKEKRYCHILDKDTNIWFHLLCSNRDLKVLLAHLRVNFQAYFFACFPVVLHVAQVFCMLPRLHRSEKTRVSCTSCHHPFPIAMQCPRLCCNATFHNAVHLYFALHHIVRLQLALKIELPSPSATQCFVLNCRTFICSAPKLGQPHFWVHWTRVQVYTARFF